MVTKQSTNESSEHSRIAAEAAVWFAKLQGPSKAGALAAFKDWLAESPEHAQAFDSLTDMWEMLPGAAMLDNDMAKAAKQRKTIPGLWTFASAVAAGLALFFVLRAHPLDKTVYSTAVGEQRSVVLPDGSYVALNTDTKVIVRFRNAERHVELESGEAAFEVAKDKSRPFIVSVAGERVTALGTKFNVRTSALSTGPAPDTRIVVTLIEGRVEVARPPSIFEVKAPPKHVRVLEPGERVTIDVPHKTSSQAAETVVVDRPDLMNLMAWQHGEIMFDDVPMVTAIAELNRYSGKHILLGDSSLQTFGVSGVFHIRDTDGAVDLIARTHGLRVRFGSDGSIVLQR